MKAFTRSPKTWVAMMATASRHPQRRRLNQAVPATAMVAPSKSREFRLFSRTVQAVCAQAH